MQGYDNKRLARCLEKILEIPSFPSVAIRALSLSLKEDVDIKSLAEIVSGDPALVLIILKQANSSEKIRRKKITDVYHAISLLGMSDLQCILLSNISFRFLEKWKENKDASNLHKEILNHSLITAIFAYLLAKVTYPELKDEAFSCGILHDVGKLAILLCEGENYIKAVKDRNKNGKDSLYLENEILGFDHTILGRRLAKEWNLSESLIEVISYHHLNVQTLGFVKDNFSLICIVKLANILSHEFVFDGEILEEENNEKNLLIKELKLNNEELKNIKDLFLEEYKAKTNFFDIKENFEEIFLETVERANRYISQLALKLSKQKRELKRNYEFQKLINKIGLVISEASNVKELFQNMARVFVNFPLFKAGLIYVLDRENWILEGHIWHQSKKSRSIRCFLDKEGRPVWDQQTSKFPTLLKELFSSYKKRIFVEQAAKLDLAICYKYPFYTVPLYSEKIDLQGELCLTPASKGFSISDKEKLYLSQVIKLVVSTLENIRLIERLEKKNEELTYALWRNQQLQKQVLHTERLAIAGQLAAGAAHEINNPLAVINARAQLLQLKETDEVKKKQLNQIIEQIERISNILTRLMDFARPAPPTLTSVDIHFLLDKVLDFIGPGLRKHKIIVKKDYAKDLPSIKADPTQLEQVFLNLIINAQHSMEQSGGMLRLKTSLNSADKQVIIEIADQGCGIPQKQLKNVFDPFFTTKEPGKGTGLGLSISNSIIENHYGKLEIKSKEGEGTTVKVILPLDIHELREPDFFDSYSKQPKTYNIKPKILVVDDEKHIREILCETLEEEGMETNACSNGAEALELLEKKKFDLILLDMKMPVLDGLSLINAIKRKDLNIPIIVITGMATHEEIKDALSKGVYKCIKKPFHIKSLLKDIKSILSKEGLFEKLSV